ncbi:MAG: Hint domain-containing protein [Chloroflexota bacterium]|nr:Hint domain-containing protein [Chloroflexota bacterium]
MRALFGLVLLLAACGGDSALASPSPTSGPGPLTTPELKYRVLDAGGRISFCDPDFYPVARADESDLAKAKIAEIQADANTYAVITARVGADPLMVYREWKALRALTLTPAGADFTFAYRSNGANGPYATADPKLSGKQIEGSVTVRGSVNITKRADAGPLNCPICLAVGTRIATPDGDIAVESLRVGDIVWTAAADGTRVAAPLSAIGSTPVPATHEVVRLALADGRIVLVSPGHPTADGRRVGDLRAGDAIDGALVVSAVRVAYIGGFTYDVLPASASGAYWANGVLLGSTLR